MTVEELQTQFLQHREQFIDHRARVESDLVNLQKGQDEHKSDMNEALKGIRTHIKELIESIPNNGWKSKAIIGGGTGGTVLLIHALAKIFGIEI